MGNYSDLNDIRSVNSLEQAWNSICIHLTIDPQQKIAFLEDTTRGHSISVKNFTLSDDKITIVDVENEQWVFVLLTKKKLMLSGKI